MPRKNRLFLAGFLTLLAAVLGIWFSPFAVSNGVRLWIWWKARQEGFIVNIDKIDAPFLRPVVLRGFRVASVPSNALRIDLTATQATLDLNFKRILLHISGHAIRTLSIQELRGELRHSNPPGRAITQRGWSTLHKLLPGNFSIGSSEIRIEDGPTLILLRSALLSADEIEAGRFSAGGVVIESPWLRQTFSQLRGATRWDGDRLALAGLTLTRGLDLQSISADLSRLGNQDIELDFDADAFGGKIRGNISHEWGSQRPIWKVAGAATDISLAQTSEAIGFTDHLDGLLHACNFSFRGNLADPTQVTASLWTEVTGLTWRNRTAEAIMLGATLYNEQIQLQQLYIKQKTNQLTLNGQASFPSKPSDWLSPDFRGDISATINNLDDFSTLFGANSGDFAGKLAIEGALATHARQLGGHLTIDGTSLTLFKTAIDTLSAKLKLEGTELAIEQFDLKRKNDSLTAQGKIDMSHEHSYSGTLAAVVDNLADYLSIIWGPTESNSKPTSADVRITIDSNRWDLRGGIGLPGSSTLKFTANFLLPIGINWNAFLASPVNLTFDFPSIFLANVPQVFHPEIFRDGILSGKLSLSETLQRPHIVGDLQLVNGKFSEGGRTSLDLTEASSRITFSGNRASVDFFNAATKDVDLSLRGEIDFHDANALTIMLTGATPILDLTPRPIDCVSRIEIGSVATTLAPVIADIDIRGGLFQSEWTISLNERTSSQSSPALDLSGTARKFPLCLSTNAEEKTLLLSVPPRPEPRRETVPQKRRTKRR